MDSDDDYCHYLNDLSAGCDLKKVFHTFRISTRIIQCMSQSHHLCFFPPSARTLNRTTALRYLKHGIYTMFQLYSNFKSITIRLPLCKHQVEVAI